MTDTPQAGAARDERATDPEGVRHEDSVVTEEEIGEEHDEMATEPEDVRHQDSAVTEEEIGEP